MTDSRGRALVALLGTPPGDAGALDVRPDEAMARHTTLRLGGPADLWCRPSTLAGLRWLLARTHELDIPVSFVGAGTNLLVHDAGIRGAVVNLGKLNAVERPNPGARPGDVYVEAGASTGRLLSRAMAWHLGGVEFLAGVPGSVGGGLVMNAGTVLGEFTDVVVEVRSLTRAGKLLVRDHAACGFRYRASDLPSAEIVVSADLRLTPRPIEDIKADVRGLRERRKAREPAGVANCGSTFKNPEGDYAGRLIEAAGLKGVRRGDVVVSPKHANWLVVDPQEGRAVGPRTRDYLELMAHVTAEVKRVHGVVLEPEVRLVGDPGAGDVL